MSLLIDSALKISLLIALALAAAAVLRRQSAALRHCVLAWTMASAAALPALALVAPSWSLPAVTSLVGPEAIAGPAAPQAEGSHMELRIAAPQSGAGADRAPGSMHEGGPPAPAAWGRTAAAPLVMSLWIAGLAWMLGTLAAGLARLRWLSVRAASIEDGPWAGIAQQISRTFGLRRPVRLLRSDHPTLLVTWGWRRPVVLLPAGADDWSSERIRVVLAHELAHVRRGDWALQLGAQLMRSVYWFNPLVWIACRRMAHESERACDDAVVSQGIEGARYAGHLLELARVLRGRGRLSWPAPAIVRPSTLERRVTAMLSPRINRRPVPAGLSLAAALVVFGLAVPIAGLQALAQTFSSLSGTVVDPDDRPVPRATLTLANDRAGSRYEIRSDTAGQFEFVGLPPGDYALQAEAAGFRTFRDRVTVEGRDLRRDIALKVGTVIETIVVTPGDSAPGGGAPGHSAAAADDHAGSAQRIVDECRTSSAAGPQSGSHLRPPRKVMHVAPRYPEGLPAAGVGGVVKLNTRIGTDGTVVGTEAVGPAVDPALVASAIEAVSKWKFEPTLLNCVPVEVEMEVSIEFHPVRTAR